MPSFAYLFERFPAFTQTFCYREVTEVVRKGVDVAIYSIRPAEGEVPIPPTVSERIQYLPDPAFLKDHVQKQLDAGSLPKLARQALTAKVRRDTARLREALWLGPQLQKEGISHLHAHFAGIASRTAYWIKQLYGISYSFTGHANDIFEESDFPITTTDLIRQAAFVVTETNYSRDWLKEHSPEHAEKIYRVYNGIDIDMESPSPKAEAPAREDARKAQILSVGRLIEKKGHRYLIEACALLRDRGVDFAGTIIGDGPLRESLQAQIESLALGDRIRLTGALPFEEVRALFRCADVFALSCSPEADGGMDNFPTVIIEAMLHGVPVISTRLAGVPEMVEEKVTGVLLEESDSSALAEALETLINDRERSRAMGAAGYQRVSERFSVAVTSQELLDLITKYQDAANRRKGVRRWLAQISSMFQPRKR